MCLIVLDESMDCVLRRQDEMSRKEHAIYYLSKKFTCEFKYSSLEKTCCALAWVARRLRQYMLTHTTLLITKMDPIRYIFEKFTLTRRIAHWQILLSEYDIQYVTQKAIKGSVLSEYLSHWPMVDYQPMWFEFLYEDIMFLTAEKFIGDDERLKPRAQWKFMFSSSTNGMEAWNWNCLNLSKRQLYSLHNEVVFQVHKQYGRIQIIHHGYWSSHWHKDQDLKGVVYSPLVIYQVEGKWETCHP